MKSKKMKYLIGIVFLIVITVIFILVFKNNNNNSIIILSDDDVVIVSNPINLDQIKSISLYRSCAGHEFATSDYLGNPEPLSSAKHYITPLDSLVNKKINVYAPFNGEIVFIDPNDIEHGSQFYIEQRPYNGWTFGFDHIYMKDGLKKGSIVKAGEYLGYATIPNVGYSFDIILQGRISPDIYKNRSSKTYTSYLDSIFNHMSEKVEKEFNSYGFTKDKMIISKKDRQKNPCTCSKSNTDYCIFENNGDINEIYSNK